MHIVDVIREISDYGCADCNYCNEHSKQDVDQCPVIKKLKDADKHRWHDLRKNQNDLPEEGRMILYVFRYELCSGRTYKIREYKNGDLSNATTLTYIAWKYIEPFEEDKQ